MIPRRLLLSLACFALWAAPMSAERVVQTIEIDPQRTVADEGGLTRALARLDAPGVGAPAYLVRGRVRTDGVVGIGYLELWSDLGAKGRFFSRTLGSAGPMQNLAGTQDWRAFALPFMLGDAPAPEALELNVVLPGRGEVFVDGVELVQLDSEQEVGALLGAGPPGAGLPFGAAPLLGALVGGLAVVGFVVWRRRASRAELRRISALDAGGGL
jgi:hypothetical protein